MTAVPLQMPPSPDDAALLRAIAAGDLRSLGDLFDRYEPPIRRYLQRLGVPQADLDDLVQVTFLEVVGAAARFDARQPAKSWLFGIATLMVRRHRRSFVRRLARIAAFAASSTSASPPTPAEIAAADEAEHRLARAFDRMSPKKREAFVLVTLEGLSGDEAARALGVPINTVWTRLHHARLELRAALEDEGR